MKKMILTMSFLLSFTASAQVCDFVLENILNDNSNLSLEVTAIKALSEVADREQEELFHDIKASRIDQSQASQRFNDITLIRQCANFYGMKKLKDIL